MGTYITVKLKPSYMSSVDIVNAVWDKENPGYENTFHLSTQEDMKEWLKNIHTDPDLKHLRYIENVSQLNKVFPLWGLGCFQVKITLGDYLCSEMARRYYGFFRKYGDFYFEKHPLQDEYVTSIIVETMNDTHKAEDCYVDCLFCTG